MSREDTFNKFVKLRLGASAFEIELETRADIQHATDLMASQARLTLDVFSRDLDPVLYGRDVFVQALGALCTRNRKARVRFLVQEPLEAVRGSPRLVELSRQLSSSIEIRQPHSDYRHFNGAFLIADRCGVIQREFADRYEGSADFYAPIEAQRKLDFFTEVWERSAGHPELRRLHL